MKKLIALAVASIVGITAVGCEHKTTTERKAEVTSKGPGGETKTTVDQKVERTPDSETKTTTQKTESKSANP